jgi:hypothetical protein
VQSFPQPNVITPTNLSFSKTLSGSLINNQESVLLVLTFLCCNVFPERILQHGLDNRSEVHYRTPLFATGARLLTSQIGAANSTLE